MLDHGSERRLTKAEARLVTEGDTATVRAIRRRFQDVMGDEICALVEDITRRKVGTFLSDHHPTDDVAVELVVFAEASGALPNPASEVSE